MRRFELDPALRAEICARAQEIERVVPYVVLEDRLRELLQIQADGICVDSDRLLAIYALIGAAEMRPVIQANVDDPA